MAGGLSGNRHVFDPVAKSEYVRMEYHVSDAVEKLRREFPASDSIANYNIIENETWRKD